MKDTKYLAGENDYEFSYSKICGKKIKDLWGYVTTEFGDATFKLTTIVFEDGTKQGVEGEHDLPYLVDYDEKTMILLEKLHEE